MQTELYGQDEALVHQTEVALLRGFCTFCMTFTYMHTHEHTCTLIHLPCTAASCTFQTNFALPATTVSAPSNDHINQISHLWDGTIVTCSSVSTGGGSCACGSKLDENCMGHKNLRRSTKTCSCYV